MGELGGMGGMGRLGGMGELRVSKDFSNKNKKILQKIALLKDSEIICFNEKRRLPTLPHCIAVPSAQAGLTSLFGMGRGGTLPLSPPDMGDMSYLLQTSIM